MSLALSYGMPLVFSSYLPATVMYQHSLRTMRCLCPFHGISLGCQTVEARPYPPHFGKEQKTILVSCPLLLHDQAVHKGQKEFVSSAQPCQGSCHTLLPPFLLGLPASASRWDNASCHIPIWRGRAAPCCGRYSAHGMPSRVPVVLSTCKCFSMKDAVWFSAF